VRLRPITLSLLGAWAVLAIVTLVSDFDVALPVTIGLCLIAAWMVGSDAMFRLARSFHA
jgi:phosphatidylcholine synthase